MSTFELANQYPPCNGEGCNKPSVYSLLVESERVEGGSINGRVCDSEICAAEESNRQAKRSLRVIGFRPFDDEYFVSWSNRLDRCYSRC